MVIHVLYRKPYRISRSCVSTAGMKVVTRVITSSFTKDGVNFLRDKQRRKVIFRRLPCLHEQTKKNHFAASNASAEYKKRKAFFTFRSCLS